MHICITAAHIRITAAHIRITAAHICLTAAHIRITAAHICITAAHICITAAHISNTSLHIHSQRVSRGRSTARPKFGSPGNAILHFLFQISVSSLILQIIQKLPTDSKQLVQCSVKLKLH